MRNEFDKSIESVRTHLGFVDPDAVINQLKDIPASTKENIKRILREENPIGFVNQEFFEFLDLAIVGNRSRVVVWTDDYLDRVGAVIGQYRRQIESGLRSNLSAVSHHQDKLNILPTIIGREYSFGGKSFAIIDDCSDNLSRADQVFQELNLEGSSLVNINSGFDRQPQGDQNMWYMMNGSRIDTWLVDFNGVIIDKSAYEAHCFQKARVIFPEEQPNDF